MLRKAYKAMSLKLHPDKPGGNMEKFLKMFAAYELIKSHLPTAGGSKRRVLRRT
jgi:DnaJ-class molecular chaperone